MHIRVEKLATLSLSLLRLFSYSATTIPSQSVSFGHSPREFVCPFFRAHAGSLESQSFEITSVLNTDNIGLPVLYRRPPISLPSPLHPRSPLIRDSRLTTLPNGRGAKQHHRTRKGVVRAVYPPRSRLPRPVTLPLPSTQCSMSVYTHLCLPPRIQESVWGYGWPA